jgi:dolichol kinase
LEPLVATTVSGALLAVIIVVRLKFRQGLRGVAGMRSTERWGEIAYPLAGTVSLAIGWLWLGDRWLAFAPIAFMAWGDNLSGLVRDNVGTSPVRRFWPSAAMLAVCLIVALTVQPYWAGAVGALAATAVESYRPTTHPAWDDNWAVVAASLCVMGPLTAAIW